MTIKNNLKNTILFINKSLVFPVINTLIIGFKSSKDLDNAIKSVGILMPNERKKSEKYKKELKCKKKKK
jgi:hypothetical protein